MKTIRRFADLGRTRTDWLDGRHSFSFGRYVDRAWMGFGPLRVINNDTVSGGGGFSPHPHDNMEIITYVTDGALAHRDSLGNDAVIRAGDLQMMSAGSGIRHAEFNDSPDQPLHLFQIWIEPNVMDEAPTYQELKLDEAVKPNILQPLVTRDGRNGTMRIKANAELSIARIGKGRSVTLPAASKAMVWVQMTRGSAIVDGVTLDTGDAVGLEQEKALTLTAVNDAEALVFEMTA